MSFIGYVVFILNLVDNQFITIKGVEAIESKRNAL